jgi:Trp operon repressor
MGFSRKRQSIQVGLAKVCAALAPNMQFYFYIIDRKIMGAKWLRALALLLCKEERELLEVLVLEVLEERLQHNVTYREVNTAINQ